jgi:RNA polymerase sigma-70 factor (ECF subfamily)
MTGLTSDEASDASIIGKSLAEPHVFEEIFNRHYRTIYRYVARRLGRDAADDIASDVFLRAFDGRHRYDQTRASCVPWLYGIASNVCRTTSRSRFREARAVRRLEAVDAMPDTAEGIAWRLDASDAVNKSGLIDAVNALRVGERETLYLHVFGELSYSEIADAMAVPVGTVRSRLSRTKAKLREPLERLRERDIDKEGRWTN